MVGMIPLAIHVPERAPTIRRITRAEVVDFTFSEISEIIVLYGTPL